MTSRETGAPLSSGITKTSHQVEQLAAIHELHHHGNAPLLPEHIYQLHNAWAIAGYVVYEDLFVDVERRRVRSEVNHLSGATSFK